jgi:hypothetical protein
MAGDDKNEDGFDPWADLESAPTPDLEGEFDFAFDDKPAAGEEPVAESPVDRDPPAPAEVTADFTGEPDDGLVGDESVSDWLAEAAAGGDEPTTLGLFAGDDEPGAAEVADPERVIVGTGESGIVDDDDAIAAAGDDEPVASTSDEGFSWGEIEAESVSEPNGDAVSFGVVGSDREDQPEEGIDFAGISATDDADGAEGEVGAEAAAVAVVSAATTPGVKPVKRRPVKKGGLGQMIGVVLGGLLALPITFAILIWGFRKDPLNLVRHVPESAAFLFPQELVGGGRPKVDGVAGGPTLDDVPDVAVDEPPAPEGEAPAAEPPAEPVADRTAVTAAEPADAVDPLMANDATAAIPAPSGDQPASAPLVPDASDLAALVPADPAVPMVEPLDAVRPEPVAPAEPPPPPAAPEREPLDLVPIENAVAAAAEAFEAVKAAEIDADPDPIRRDRSRNRLLVDWYRQLSTVAEELAGLERFAADTGRPLTAPPEAVSGLQASLVADPTRLTDLARLSRNWMAYPGRSTSGVVMPAVLGSVRQVGPYWCSTVTIAEAGDRTRDMAVISRSEPVAVAGETVLVTGLIVDGDTVWASDVRPARADVPATSVVDEPVAADPFAAPADQGVTPAQPAADPADGPFVDPFATPDP